MSNLVQPGETGIQQIVTVDLKVSFLRPDKGEYLLANARIVKDGKNLLHAECNNIYNDQEEFVAISSGIFF
jgi:acyl-coenzyme A thioesterase PaaI-like protein